jgi:glutathione S-transferase
LPSGLRPLIAVLIRRKVRTTLYGQGISRHDPTRIAALGGEDLRSLSTLLGSRPFFLGDRPTVVDASAYGMLANLLAFPERTPLKLAVESHANLIEFCGRIKSAYWNAN